MLLQFPDLSFPFSSGPSVLFLLLLLMSLYWKNLIKVTNNHCIYEYNDQFSFLILFHLSSTFDLIILSLKNYPLCFHSSPTWLAIGFQSFLQSLEDSVHGYFSSVNTCFFVDLIISYPISVPMNPKYISLSLLLLKGNCTVLLADSTSWD